MWPVLEGPVVERPMPTTPLVVVTFLLRVPLALRASLKIPTRKSPSPALESMGHRVPHTDVPGIETEVGNNQT